MSAETAAALEAARQRLIDAQLAREAAAYDVDEAHGALIAAEKAHTRAVQEEYR